MRVLVFAAIGTIPARASAHVKWFANYNLSCRPRSPIELFQSEVFLLFLLFVTPIMFFVTFVDRTILRRRIADRAAMVGAPLSNGRWEQTIERWTPTALRLAVSAFFLTLFLMAPGGDQPLLILTPELKTYTGWVRWIQLAIAAFALFESTAWIAALGLVVLFGKAVQQYGSFHMLDYPIFLGVAAYIFLWSVYGASQRVTADAVLRATTALSLMWGGIEKFVYPEWAMQVLDQQPMLALGFEPHFFVTAAAFVEFCASFVLITGQLASRVCALLLIAIMSLGIAVFGMVDAIGHSVILVVLLLLALQSKNPITYRFEPGGVPRAGITYAGLFVVALIGLLCAYVGGHYLAYHLPAS
jgi:hypothetical protein